MKLTSLARVAFAFLAATAALAFPARAQVVEMLARLDGLQETPPNSSPATGIGFFSIDTAANTITYRILYTGLSSTETAAHIHGFSGPGIASGILFALPLGTLKCGVISYTPAQQANILAGLTYVNVHSTSFPGGEIRGQISELPAHPTFCYGDGTGTACPCANFSALGDNEGCLNSFGIGARLVAYGNASLSNDQLELHFLRGPPNTPALFFQGSSKINGGAGIVFGDGLRCIATNVMRLRIKFACNGQVGLPEPGDFPISVLGAIPPFPLPIPPYYYQAWYREPPAFCTPATFNLSNAVEVQWSP